MPITPAASSNIQTLQIPCAPALGGLFSKAIEKGSGAVDFVVPVLDAADDIQL